MRRFRSDTGFTLIEVLVASTILLVGVLATVTLLQVAARANTATRQHDAATSLAREFIEAVRIVPYDNMTDTGVAAKLQDIPGLDHAGGSGYAVKRGDVTYDVTVDICVMDDPRDGGGPRSASTAVCSGSAPAGTQDANPEDYKMSTVRISWRHGGSATRSVVQTGVVSNPGSANGPAIRSIAPRGSYPAPISVTSSAAQSVIVDITTSSRPHAINWLLDGSVQQPPPVANGPSGLAWAFTWNIGNVDTGVLDGAYIVSAEAFNQFGVSGPGRQETITLNRRRPFPPRQVAGGRTNFGTVEIEWTANSERDIAGYEVYRDGTPVCTLAVQKLDTFCVDPAPPAGALLRYTVRAFDKHPVTGAPREGDPSVQLNVVASNQPPQPPTNLTATRKPDGTVALTWKRPTVPEDPDVGDGVEFYRIYRDGKAIGNRFARWFDAGATVTWDDTATGGTLHTYWVTAVDKHYAESVQLGPKTA